MTPHTHSLRVYYEDTDAGGVMYHAQYLAFAERARTEALRASGLPHSRMQSEHGVIFMVRRLTMEYLRPARLDDLLTIRTEALSCGGATVDLRQEFFADRASLAVACVSLACVRTQDGRAARIPPAWRALLTPATPVQ